MMVLKSEGKNTNKFRLENIVERNLSIEKKLCEWPSSVTLA
jgi:hypothetical protein